MTNRRPPPALRIQSFFALEFCQCISRAWFSILDGFSCNYLRPHHSGSLLVGNCSSTEGSRSNMWELLSWGCLPSQLSPPPWVEIHSPAATGNTGHKSHYGNTDQGTKETAGSCNTFCYCRDCPARWVRALEEQPCPVICRGDLSW